MSLEVATLNNEAICMIMSRKYEAALELFSCALNLHKVEEKESSSSSSITNDDCNKMIIENTTTSTNTTSSSTNNNYYYSTIENQQQQQQQPLLPAFIPSSTTASSTSTTTTMQHGVATTEGNNRNNNTGILPARIPATCFAEASSPHNGFVFYKRLFYITPNGIDEKHDNVLLSMVLYFNMAATCQRIGLEYDSAYFYKSLALYKMVISLSNTFNESNADIIHKSGFQVLLMSVFTNMGHIYSHFFLDNEITLCRAFLESIILRNPNARYFMDNEEYLTFFLNSSLFTDANLKIQAAAAA